jgi:urea carboxylase
MFERVLIANRGAIATRIARTLRRMGVASVAVYSDADAASLHVRESDHAIRIGPPQAAESYLNTEAIFAAARASGAQAIHPGYGFLSENAEFADRCAAAGLVFIGPTPDNIRAFGLKHLARSIAAAHDVPLATGTGLLSSAADAVEAAEAIGYPIILKATAGGGGIGMRVCADASEIAAGFETVARLGAGNFGDGGVFLERYVATARHIEVQVFGDGAGRVIDLGERDCSLQRRNQKVIEETPAPNLPRKTRQAIIDCAVRMASAANYRSAGTVEFLYDAARKDFFFLEVNTRLQVEHGVTEQVTGVDLVEWMVRGAAGDFSFMDAGAPKARGASIQVRLYAEDPAQDYRPSTGRLIDVSFPAGPRIESWVESGSEIGPHYDPMLAKLIVTAPNRKDAVRRMQEALDQTTLSGIETNLSWLREVVRSDLVVEGAVSTRALSTIDYHPTVLRIISGGASTTVQDFPGRIGFWDVGVPPSGPMDALAFRLGNRLLGNAESCAGLEITAAGPTLQFACAASFILTGADFGATLDEVAISPYAVTQAKPGQVLRIGRVTGHGLRGYLLVAGGIEAPLYLGSRSAFTLGEFGGHAGRVVMAGDTLRITPSHVSEKADLAKTPDLTREWSIRVLYGPHGSPDFFTPSDIDMISATHWRVHYNSNRTGVRLTGPKPEWARKDGGEAGLHPSNIHDNAYAVGAIDFTGDMPIILGPDGPSLGGFVCPFVVIQADLWKIGQLAPGDLVVFTPVADAEARRAEVKQDEFVRSLVHEESPPASPSGGEDSPVLRRREQSDRTPAVVYRRQGDRNVLVEYGPIVLDIELRFRIHALMLKLRELRLPGIVDITPGIRSMQVHFDARILRRDTLLDALEDVEAQLADLDDFEIPSRIVHLPLSWGDPAIWQTIDKYMNSVRDDAPWCPDNIEFIRRINGLSSVEDVKDIVFAASYLVMGLGDVYLGAPVATPVDPRHRLVTTKYNPARTWTPPNVVGIGGAYMCIYGMEGPGGYQLVGRTIQVWNTWRRTPAFAEGTPWLLRFFDQIRFFPVSADELVAWRRDFPLGRRQIKIEDSVFRLSDYRAFCDQNRTSIRDFEKRRNAAFADERHAWEVRGEFDRIAELAKGDATPAALKPIDQPTGSELVESPLGGSIWRMLVREGADVSAGDPLAVIEAMKMETQVTSPLSGRVVRVYISEGQTIGPGAPLFALVSS